MEFKKSCATWMRDKPQASRGNYALIVNHLQAKQNDACFIGGS